MHSHRWSQWFALHSCTTSTLSRLWRILTRHGMILLQEMFKKHHQNLCFFIRGACFYHEKVRTLDYKGVRTGILCGFEFYRTAIKRSICGIGEICVREKSSDAARNVPTLSLLTAHRSKSFFCWNQDENVKLFWYLLIITIRGQKRTKMRQKGLLKVPN